jgi:signal transduction histidine kinase
VTVSAEPRVLASAFVPLARAGRTVDRALVLSLGVGIASTILVLLPGVHGHAIVPAFDLVIDTVVLVACATLTALAWARFRESHVSAAACHASAFLALAAAAGIAVVVSLFHSRTQRGLTEPEDVQVLVFAVAQLAAAVLFVIAGAFTKRRSSRWHPQLIVATPMLAVVGAYVFGLGAGPPPEALQIISFRDASGLPDVTPFGAALHLLTAGLFFLGAFVSRALWRAEHAVIDGWIAVGLVLAGFAQLQWTLYPSAHPGQVSTGDLLWLACSVMLLYGLEKSVRGDLRTLRVANAELAELRDADVERAALEERARLARELHDGLAQDLWLAKLRAAELAGLPGLSVEARRTVRDVSAAIDTGLGEARQAVVALRSQTQAKPGFCNLVRRTVADYGDRFGLRVEFACDGDEDAQIEPRTQAEILRIVQEAMTNVARHADATVVGVLLRIHGDRVKLRVVDNGRGFDTAAAGDDAFGLASMRERAALIGGRLRIASRVGTGTGVVLFAPLTRQAPMIAAHSMDLR